MKHTTKLLTAATLVGMAASAQAAVIFTESFEVATGNISPGAVTFDNAATNGLYSSNASATNNGGGFNVQINGIVGGATPTDGSAALHGGAGGAIGTSVLWTIAAANTLTNGQTVEVTWDATQAHGDGDETYDMVIAGGAASTNGFGANDAFGTWNNESFSFLVTDATQAITLEFGMTRTASDTADLVIDNISVNAVPEPSSTALLGLGGLALILRRRK